MSETTAKATFADRAADATPPALARRLRPLSDRAIAWLFIAPTIVLLLAINIFPLIWTIYLSFTNYQANRPNAEIQGVGLRHYTNILTDTDVWHSMQVTAHFVFWTIAARDAARLRASPTCSTGKLPRPRLLDDRHPHPDDAVAGGGRKLLEVPLPAADRPLQLRRLVLHRRRPASSFQMIGDVGAGALGDHHRRRLDVDALRDADLPRRAALHPRLHLRGGRGRPRLPLAAVLVDHAADGAALHHAGGALPRHRELQDVRPVNLLTSGGPGSTTEVASITLKREAFESWKTGYSSALRHHPLRRGVRPRQHLREGAQPGEAEMSAPANQAHSVVAPSGTAKSVAASLVIVYALITMIPLAWIVMTSFKTPPELDRLPAEARLHAVARGLLQPLHHPLAADAGIHRRAAAGGDDVRRDRALARTW